MILKTLNIRLPLLYVLFLILFSADAFGAETPLIKVGDLFPDIELIPSAGLRITRSIWGFQAKPVFGSKTSKRSWCWLKS